jgi:hypothetical protein
VIVLKFDHGHVGYKYFQGILNATMLNNSAILSLITIVSLTASES